MSNNTYTVPAAYIRVASTSIAAYDYLRTFPTAYDFYETEWKSSQISVSLCLFVLIRFTSIALLIISNIGFFDTHFSFETCSRFYLIAPIFKAFQIMISQCIMGVRTYNLSGRSKGIGYFLLVFYLIACGLQWYSNLYNRRPSFEPAIGDCLGKLLSGDQIGSWFYYVIAIVYDITTTTISVSYLVKYKRTLSNTSIIFRFIDSMLYDGMGYFVMLTVPNAVNLALFQSHDPIQTAAVTIGYVMTWLMSQKLILNQYKARMHHRLANSLAMPTKPPRPIPAATPEHHTGSTMDITTSPIISSLQAEPTDTDIYGTRSAFITDDEAELGLDRGTWAGEGEGESQDAPGPGLQVRFERSVCVERSGRTRGPGENYGGKGRWGW
ncbi:hypothetical protein BS17DRAFT_789051 [Gyrodon lividus]|nr:hypothetical protein BS17DRAFT_789051 [Gyrodon lividus]